jgi:2-polyprenyl-3-methyl-5-hydroxy-6-metoxy-1,4-benzoquinol methylase
MPEHAGPGRPEGPTRFSFGANWSSFSKRIDDQRIAEARSSLSERLGDLAGLTFLDAGCGSGLFSLAAVQLGARRVLSFDFDDGSVATALALKCRHAPEVDGWTVERGDILDRDYVDSLGSWDVVYSWGVLHHTGEMVAAWGNVAELVAPGGRLFISIYNDQGHTTRLWSLVKRTYHRIPRRLQPLYVVLTMAPREAASAAISGPRAYLRNWRDYKRNRGMSRWHDLVDWVGGYPFEVATPESVFAFFHARAFELDWMLTCRGGSGCNQFVLTRRGARGGTARER